MTSNALLSLSALEAAVELRNYVRAHPEVTVDVAIESLYALKPGATNLDFKNGLFIHETLPIDLSFDVSGKGLRDAIRFILEIETPNWMRFIPYGRDRVRAVLHRDEIQCLREAGLLDVVPDNEALAWWDVLAARERAISQSATMEQARTAERLSYEKELARLALLGTSLRPQWVSIEDNSLGYDIKSYSLTDHIWSPRMIEVKSTKDGTVHISKNEWRNAATSANYVFHVWVFPDESFHEIKVSDVSEHIPVDRGVGSWESVQIKLEL
jgi:hypothetical protein